MRFRLIGLALLGLLALGCGLLPKPAPATVEVTREVIREVTSTPEPTSTPKPTATPTATLTPTATPEPTREPAPAATAIPEALSMDVSYWTEEPDEGGGFDAVIRVEVSGAGQTVAFFWNETAVVPTVGEGGVPEIRLHSRCAAISGKLIISSAGQSVDQGLYIQAPAGCKD